MNSSTETGFLYAAVGDQYIAEAKISALSIRKQMPMASITLITDRVIQDSIFDNVITLPKSETGHKGVKLYKPHALANTPYDKTVFLDSDTYICHNCEELFEIIDYMEMALAQDTADMSNPTIDGELTSGIYPYNSGVIVFSKSSKMKQFFRNWHDLLKMEYDDHPWDQRAMMTTLITEKTHCYTLNPVYNCRTNFIVSLPQLPVKIIHGRGIDFEKTEKKLNKVLKNRVWLPKRQKVLLKKKRGFLRMLADKSIQKLKSLK